MLTLLRMVEAGRQHNPEVPGIGRLISMRVLKSLLAALHYRDVRTMLHARRTSLISVGIAERLGWEAEAAGIVELAALLHDMGKICVPDHILLKPGRLSPDEAEFIAVQNRVAISLLQACSVDPEVIDLVAQSHGLTTRADPLSGQIHLGARILAVADAFDSLTTTQTFRLAFEHAEAMKILEDQSGKQFDRNVVAALGRWLESTAAAGLQAFEGASLEATAVSVETLGETLELCHLMNSLHGMESLYQAVVMVDANMQIQVWNSGAERIFHRNPREVLGAVWDPREISIIAISGNDGSTALHDCMHTKNAACRRLLVKRDTESTAELEIHAIPLHDGRRMVGALGLIYDIKQSRKNEGQFRQLQMAATRDALTGVYNRGELDEQLKQHFGTYQASKGHVPFSVIFFDLDHFKSINDRLGHAVGDRVLIDTARLMQDETYSGEVVGRYGGEEFVIVCPETVIEDATERAERLRRALMAARIASRADARVTASFGVAQVEPGDTVETLVKRADAALYEAKRSGRNRTCCKRREPDVDVGKGKNNDTVWVVRQDLITNVAADLIVYKIKGFIQDVGATLITSSAKNLVVQCGTAGLLGWGSRPEKQPVKVSINIQDAPLVTSNSKRVLLKTTVEPVSRPMRSTTFQERAAGVLNQLRSYCIADFYHPENS